MDSRTMINALIEKSGKHGHAGHDGHTSCNGTAGSGGKPASNIDIILNADNDAKIIYLSSKDDSIAPAQLPLGYANASISLKARGGMGGKGGDGGRGYDGRDGTNGWDATSFSSGTNGTNGEDGGPGGHGGAGGDGGAGGNATVTVADEDTDLLMLVQPDLQGGKGGAGGHGGAGGSGGRGGSGGSGHSWTESHSHTDSDGQTHTHTTFHHNPGGSDGSNGSSGRRGNSGNNGSKGHDGKYTIIVPTVGTYNERYNIQVASHAAVQSEDNIIEPGELLEMSDVVLKNITSMPSPPKIDVSFVKTGWIGFQKEHTVTTNQSIPASGKLTLEKPLKFHIKPAGNIPAIDTTFYEKTVIPFKAKIARVNKRFETVCDQKAPIIIRYPIEASVVAHAETITLNEALPFAIKLRNVSTLPIGYGTKTDRPLTLQLALQGSDAKQKVLALSDKSNHQLISLSEPFCMNIALPAGESAYFSGTLQFMDVNIQPYTKFNLSFNLSLGNVNNYAKMDCIQKRNFDIQFADDYRFDPKADFVLVTHSNTKKATVDAWKTLANKFGASMSVWNASLYGGLSYNKMRNDQGSFKTQLQNKVVIILNDSFTLNGKKQVTADFLDQKEILEAAKSSNIATLVVGQSFDIKEAAAPAFQSDYFYEEVVIKDLYFKWNKPTYEHLKKKAAELERKLRYQAPSEQYFMELQLDPLKLSAGIFDEWQVGRVKLYQALNMKKTCIAYRQKSDNSIDEYDAFNMIKLLPFDKKLQYFSSCKPTDDNVEMFKNAILSDLMDELDVFASSTWLGDFSREKISSSLTTLNALEQFDFSCMQNDKRIKHAVSKLLVQYKYITSQLPSTSDAIWFPWLKRRAILADICQQKVNAMLKAHFPGEDFSEEEKALAKHWKKIPKEEIFHRFSNAYLAGTVYNNHLDEDRRFSKEEIKPYVAKNSFFTEGRHVFRTPEDRVQCLEFHEKRCAFDLKN